MNHQITMTLIMVTENNLNLFLNLDVIQNYIQKFFILSFILPGGKKEKCLGSDKTKNESLLALGKQRLQ